MGLFSVVLDDEPLLVFFEGEVDFYFFLFSALESLTRLEDNCIFKGSLLDFAWVIDRRYLTVSVCGS